MTNMLRYSSRWNWKKTGSSHPRRVSSALNGALQTTVYRKPTHTKRYLNFHSNNPDSVKLSVATSLFNRLRYITAGEEEIKQEENRIIMDLKLNDYPQDFIQKARHVKKQRTRTATTGETNVTACIPYVRGVSEAISRILRRMSIRTVMKGLQRKWVLMKGVKDEARTESERGEVYALGCQDCIRIYVGETGRSAKKRTEEH